MLVCGPISELVPGWGARLRWFCVGPISEMVMVGGPTPRGDGLGSGVYLSKVPSPEL